MVAPGVAESRTELIGTSPSVLIPSIAAQEGHESAPLPDALLEYLPFSSSDEEEVLDLPFSYRDQEPATFSQLIHQGMRDLRRRSGHGDDLIRGKFSPSDGPVSRHERHILEPHGVQDLSSPGRKTSDAFHRVDSITHEGQKGRKEPAPGSDFQDPVFGVGAKEVQVEGLEGRLGCSLPESDGDRSVIVRAVEHPFRDEEMSRNLIEVAKDLQVVDS